MYIWIAADVSNALAPLRHAAKLHNPGLNEVAFMLPQHISLKISFPICDHFAEHAIDQISQLLNNQPPITVRFKDLEQNGDILWLRADDALYELHNKLDTLLLNDFNVPQHPFDKEFKFHSTLFINADPAKLRTVIPKLNDYPKSVTVFNYLIGTSSDNSPGSYRVIKNISIRNQFKSKRLNNHDYSQLGCYFITICAASRSPVFWERNHLSPAGTVVEQEIQRITSIFPDVQIDKYAVMPDHLHLLITLREGAPSIPRIIQQFKGSVTKQIGKPVWQKSYYDHIIRSQADYNEKWTYIENNPKKYLLRNE